MTKRVLSMLLALIMALSLCVPAFAADEPVSADEPAPVADIQDTNQTALNDAVNAKNAAISVGADLDWPAKDVDWTLTLTIAKDKALTGSITVAKGGSLTINGEGVLAGDITVADGGSLTVNGTVHGDITSTGTVAVASGTTGSITANKGSVTISGGNVVYEVAGDAVAISGTASLTVSGGYIGCELTTEGKPGTAVGTGVNVAGSGTIAISNGYIAGNDTALTVGQGKRDNTISVTGGTFDGKIAGGSVPGFISGGKFITDDAGFNIQDTAKGATVAKITEDGSPYFLVGKAAVESAVDELTSGDSANVLQGDAAFGKLNPGVTVSKATTAGTVTVDGKEVTESAEGTGAEAKIGDKEYETLADAIKEAKAGDTIVLLSDVKPGEPVNIGKNLTIDMAGHILDMGANSITVTDAKVSFTNNGNIIGSGSGKINVTAATGKNASVSLVNTYSQLALTGSASGTGTVSASVDADSIVSVIDSFAGSVTMAGVVTGDVTVTGDADISGEVAGSVTITLGKTASVTGEVGSDLTITGNGKVTLNATVGGTTKIGNTIADEIDLTISGGEYEDVTISTEHHSDVAISGGTFAGTVTISEVKNVITGGAFNPDNASNLTEAAYVAEGSVVASVEDTQTEPTTYQSPLGETDGYYFVGSDITAALSQITKGDLTVTNGTLTLSSIGDKISVSTQGDASVKMDKVTVGGKDAAATDVTGEKITELNTEINRALRAQLSGQLSDEALQKLMDAYQQAIAPQKNATGIQKSIDDLKAALVGYEEEEDVPTAPASGTGWVETASGEWYYFNKGEMVKNQWVESGRALWYYMNPDGTLAHGGFTLVPTCRGINKDGKDAGTFAAGYFYLRHNNYNGCIGQARHGTVAIEASAVDGVAAKGTGVFETKHNGHYGACVSLNGKAVNYTDL